jgi:hypothetical protein
MIIEDTMIQKSINMTLINKAIFFKFIIKIILRFK